jgi:hypothetical protein
MMRRSAKLSKSKRHSLMLEQLEDRRMFAVTPLSALETPPLGLEESANWIPLVYAGEDFTAKFGDIAAFNGEAISKRIEGLSITWHLVSGPGTVTLGNSSSASTTVAFSAVGIYEFQLTVSNLFASANDRVRVTVAANDEERLTNNNLLWANEGESRTVTASLLATSDSDNTPSQLTYHVTAGPSHGSLRKSGAAATAFTQSDINAGLITYHHDGSETASDSFSFAVDDGVGTVTTGIFQIATIAVNDEQAITTNNPISVQSGATAAISAAMLVTSDPDNTAAQLTYTITSGPNHGTLLRAGAPSTTFTQADVNAGLVTYRNDNSQALSDSFTFTVNDGIGAASTSIFNVNVISQAPIPELGNWQNDMLTFGQQHGTALANYLQTNGTELALGATYYDAARVFYQIADYTGDSSWNTFAKLAITAYRDGYVIPNNGGVPGYWNFTRGLVLDYERTGDLASKDAAILLSHNAAFAADYTPIAWTDNAAYSREVAYAIVSYLDAERLGEPRRDRLEGLFEQALGHLDQWFVQASDPDYAPFMFALTADALIQYYQQVDQDPRILEKIEAGANWTWNNAWVAQDKAFWYRKSDRTSAPDLNLLICPVYEWLYQQTGNVQYRNQADQVFAGGVTQAWLSGPKQFNQNYRVSFDYLNMRQQQPAVQSQVAMTLPIVFSANDLDVNQDVKIKPKADLLVRGTVLAPNESAAYAETSDLSSTGSDYDARACLFAGFAEASLTTNDQILLSSWDPFAALTNFEWLDQVL